MKIILIRQVFIHLRSQ